MVCHCKIGAILAAGFIGALSGAVSSRVGAQKEDTPQKWALLIGIDRYKESDRINDLSSGARDARALKAALVEAAGVPENHIRLLVSDAALDSENEGLPDRAGILRELAALSRRAKSGDTVIVCYSGHGIELADKKTYLLPWDADPYDDGTLADTSLSEEKMVERLKQIPAGLLLLAFDMCRSQPLKTGKDGVTPPNPLTDRQMRGMDFTLPQKPLAGSPRAVVRL